MDRYEIGMTTDRQFWVIFDMKYWDAVGLPHPETGEIHRLEWGKLDYVAAEAWLNHCYRTWGRVPTTMSRHPAPIPTAPNF
jgi:hypothetical protein